ncbi:MAG: NAD(FAD)-dependent dehydrogenase [Thermoplasmata archaeon]|nr:MAG: NAD(FAD)-dependent dehydrogenase [Thermoplasmata archaeon]
MKEMICINCPLGCKLFVEKEGNEIVVKGNRCKRGEEYAIIEIKNPVRILTTTVFVEGGKHAMLPVKSDGEIPKNLLKKVMKKIANIKVKTPVKYGQVICKNVANTGINIVATRDMEEK